MDKLNELRKKVKMIDGSIIRLISQRVKLVEAIGREKKKKGIPLRDWSVEKSVMQNGLRIAEGYGLDKGVVSSIISQLIEYSRTRQERLHYSAYTGDKEEILIIGGLGAMGQWFYHFFQNQGHRVSVYDIREKSVRSYYAGLKTAIKEKTCVLISTPLSTISEIVMCISDSGFSGIVFDIASVKCHIESALKLARKKGVKITSIHPMFGPGTRTLSDKVICLCSCGCKEADQKVLGFFKDTAASIINLSLDNHDRLISFVLGLSHFINILFIKSITDSGYSFRELNRIASTTFKSQLNTANSVIHENPDLYFEIQALNPYQQTLYKNLKKNIQSLTTAIMINNRKDFIRVFKKGRQWLNETQD